MRVKVLMANLRDELLSTLFGVLAGVIAFAIGWGLAYLDKVL